MHANGNMQATRKPPTTQRMMTCVVFKVLFLLSLLVDVPLPVEGMALGALVGDGV
jgi:hypothetical protein